MLRQDDAITNTSPVVIKSYNDRTESFIAMQIFCFGFSKGIERDYKIIIKTTYQKVPSSYIILNIQYYDFYKSHFYLTVRCEIYKMKKTELCYLKTCLC